MGGALTIDRLRAECHVEGPPHAQTAVVDCASRALRHHLAGTLKAAFAPWLDGSDDSVWIVRRLDLTIAAAADSPPDVIAALVVQSLGHALSDALRGDGDGVNAIRFPNAAAYLARFVVDAAAGSAWSRWYYRPFRGLQLLPASAILRTALIATPARGLTALAALDDTDLAAVVAALTGEDEARVLEALCPKPIDVAAVSDDVFADAWNGFDRALTLGIGRGRVLFACVRAARDAALEPVVFAGRLIDGALRSAASAAAPQRPRPLRIETAEAIPPTIARAIAVHAAANAPSDSLPSAAIATRFGGLFLLLRDIDALPWASWTAGWPAPLDGTVPDVLRWLTAVVCAGHAHASSALDDCALRSVFGIPPRLDALEVGRWLRRVGHDRRQTLVDVLAADTSALERTDRAWLVPRLVGINRLWCDALALAAIGVLRRFARRLPGFAESSPEHLWRNFLAFDATMEIEESRVLLLCGRPPLHLVLTLTGMTRGLPAGHDAHGRPILVFPRV
jgi:hypothetical protein